MIAGLRRADPEALLVRGRTLEQVLARHPEARDYFRFAFVRRPCCRVRSFFADKHTLAQRDRRARRHFIAPWHGLSPGMSFDALCRWLATLDSILAQRYDGAVEVIVAEGSPTPATRSLLRTGAAPAGGGNRVGGHRGAVDHEVCAPEESPYVGPALNRQVRDAAHDGPGQIHRFGRHLVDGNLASRVTEGEIDEGAARVQFRRGSPT